MTECAAVTILGRASRITGSVLSVGLEPMGSALPEGVADTPVGHLGFLMEIVEATRGSCAAYKLNLAFFEAMGRDGWAMLFDLRAALPDDVLVIADAKRGDIGSSAERYAEALFGRLGFHAATVNPLMGEDAVRPFLNWRDRLTFALVLTSNPGADDFLVPGRMYETIAAKVARWGSVEGGGHGNAGFVVGATRPELIGRIREIAPGVPILSPGVGAQGGDAEATIRAALARDEASRPGLLIHSTRGLLPGREVRDRSQRVAMIREKAIGLNAGFASAVEAVAAAGRGG